MEVFEGSNHTFWVDPALPGWWKTFFWVVNSVWVVLPLLSFWLEYLKKVCHHHLTTKLMNRGWSLTSKMSMKKLTFIFTAPKCL